MAAAAPHHLVLVDETGVEQGPYTLDEVMAMLTAGLVTEDTLARPAEGTRRFRRLVAVLAGQARAAAAGGPAADCSGYTGCASTACAQEGEPPAEWWYRDDADGERGPLSTEQMRRAIAQGFLDRYRDVRRGRQERFCPLCQWPELAEEDELVRRKRPRRSGAAGTEDRPSGIPSGHVPTEHLPSLGHIPLGHVPSGHVPPGHVPAGHVPLGHVPPDQVSFPGHRACDGTEDAGGSDSSGGSTDGGSVHGVRYCPPSPSPPPLTQCSPLPLSPSPLSPPPPSPSPPPFSSFAPPPPTLSSPPLDPSPRSLCAHPPSAPAHSAACVSDIPPPALPGDTDLAPPVLDDDADLASPAFDDAADSAPPDIVDEADLAPPDLDDEADLAAAGWEEAPDLFWVYVDDGGGMQGPFPTALVREWLAGGFLEFKRRGGVAGVEEGEMRPLGSFPELADVIPQGEEIPLGTATSFELADLISPGGSESELVDAMPHEGESVTEQAAVIPPEGQPAAEDTVPAGEEPAESGAAGERGMLGTEAIRAGGTEAILAGAVGAIPAGGAEEMPAGGGAKAIPAGSAEAIPAGAPEASWMYVDDGGQLRGPFPTSRMGRWIGRGMVEATRLVRRAGGAGEGEGISAGGSCGGSGGGSEKDGGGYSGGQSSGGSGGGVGGAGDVCGVSVNGGGVSEALGPRDIPASDSEEQEGQVLCPLREWPELACFLLRSDAAGTHLGEGGARARGAGGRVIAGVEGSVNMNGGHTKNAAAVHTAPDVVHTAPDAIHTSVHTVFHPTPEMSPVELSLLWEYWDDRGRVQGPFSTSKLLNWLRAGHLKPSRMVRPAAAVPAEGSNTAGGAGGEDPAAFPAVAALACSDSGSGTSDGTGGSSGVGGSQRRRGEDEFHPFRDTPPFDRLLASGAAPAPPAVLPSVGGGGEAPLWYYLDASGAEQGPFTATLVQQWLVAGMLPVSTCVRHLSEPRSAHRPAATVAHLGGGWAGLPPLVDPNSHSRSAVQYLGGALHDPAAAYAAHGAGASPTGTLEGTGATSTGASFSSAAAMPLRRPQFEEYVSVGNFNSRTGKFTADYLAGDKYWDAKGLPSDRAGRQMAHYFDEDSWQQQMNARKAGGRGRTARGAGGR